MGAQDKYLVGPILLRSSVSQIVVEVIQSHNQETIVQDHGSYLRIASPHRCVLDAVEVEKISGKEFQLPADLEKIMCAFAGKLSFENHCAVWEQ